MTGIQIIAFYVKLKGENSLGTPWLDTWARVASGGREDT